MVGRQDASRNKRSGGGEVEREAESRSEQQRQWRQWRKRTRDGQPVVDRVRFQVGGFRGRMLKTNLGENALCAKFSGDNLAANAI